MAFAHFYNGKTLAYDRSLTTEDIKFDDTIGLNGSVSGSIRIEETSSNKSFLNSLYEKSHHMKFGVSKTYGGTIKGVKKENNFYTVDIEGAYELMDDMDCVPSHKATVTSNVANSEDKSLIKVFYSDSTVGVLYEVLRNNAEAMSARGFDPSVFDFSAIRDFITFNSASQTWARSYRLNYAETPTLKTVVDDVLKDSGMQLFRIRVNSNVNEPFKYIFEIVSSSSVYSINEAVDSIYSISKDYGDSKRRAYSIARGTNLQGDTVVERLNFDTTVAYSALISSANQQRSDSIGRLAATEANAAATNFGTLTFSSFKDIFDPLDYLTISSDRFGSKSGIITEKKINDATFTYTLQLGDPQKFNASIVKPTDEGRRIIFNQLNSADSLARQNAGRQDSSTGWRT